MVTLSIISLPILADTIYVHVNLKQFLNVCQIHLIFFQMHLVYIQLPCLGLWLNIFKLHLKYISHISKCISNAFCYTQLAGLGL